MDWAVVIWIVAAVLALISAVWESPYSGRLLALAVAGIAAGLALQAS